MYIEITPPNLNETNVSSRTMSGPRTVVSLTTEPPAFAGPHQMPPLFAANTIGATVYAPDRLLRSMPALRAVEFATVLIRVPPAGIGKNVFATSPKYIP